MEVPSGRVLDEFDLKILHLMHQYGFVRWSADQLTLKSGVKTQVYVYGREDVTDHPDLEWLAGRKIATLVLQNAGERKDQKQQCLIGLPTAGTALAQAASMVNFCEESKLVARPRNQIIHRMMRETLKSHGAHPDWVNGKPSPELHTYWSVDNVVTDGGTKLEGRQRLHESGYPVENMPALVFVDRQQGGIKRMEQAGFFTIVVAYYLLDLTFAFCELGLWPKAAVEAVEKEIKAYQLV